MEITRNYSVVTENWTNGSSSDFWIDNEDLVDDLSFIKTRTAIEYFASILMPILLLFGCFSNILAFVVLIRQRHLQHQHEGCLYLATLFVTNLCILISAYLYSWYRDMGFPSPFYQNGFSLFICKVWNFLGISTYDIPGWLTVAMLFGVYLREQLVLRRRFGCPNFAKKYCTVLASKIIIGIIVGLNLAYSLPQLFWSELHDTGSEIVCTRDKDHVRVVMFFIQFYVIWILPVVFLLPVILILVLCTKPGDSDFRFSQLDERYAVEAEFRKLAIYISAISFLSTFPVAVSFMHLLFHFYPGVSHAFRLLHVFYCLSLGIHPTLSLILISECRKDVQSIFRRMCFCFRGCCPNAFLLRENDESEYNVLHMDAIDDVPPTPTDG